MFKVSSTKRVVRFIRWDIFGAQRGSETTKTVLFGSILCKYLQKWKIGGILVRFKFVSWNRLQTDTQLKVSPKGARRHLQLPLIGVHSEFLKAAVSRTPPRTQTFLGGATLSQCYSHHGVQAGPRLPELVCDPWRGTLTELQRCGEAVWSTVRSSEQQKLSAFWWCVTRLTDLEVVASEVTCSGRFKELLRRRVQVTVKQLRRREEGSTDNVALPWGKFEFVEACWKCQHFEALQVTTFIIPVWCSSRDTGQTLEMWSRDMDAVWPRKEAV